MKKARRSLPLLAYQAEEALRKAVAEAIAEHRRKKDLCARQRYFGIGMALPVMDFAISST